MIETSVLNLPDFSKPFVLQTDASGFGLGVVLQQEGHRIAFFSKKICNKLKNVSTYVWELHAITMTVQKWRHYLLGHRFTIETEKNV